MATRPCKTNTLHLLARDLSYSPYSHFRVGAAILDSAGRLYAGANVENAAYSGICAERVALVKCATASPSSRLQTASKRFLGTAADGAAVQYRTLVAVGVAGDGPDFCTPCGSCRQFLREFSADVPVYLFKPTGEHTVYTLDQLLPLGFGPDSLNN